MSKKFNVDDIIQERQNELDSSPLFQREKPAPPVKEQSPTRSERDETSAPLPETVHNPAAKTQATPAEPTMTDGQHDVMTSVRHDVNYRVWKDIIENTETHNSALRLTREERYDIEDAINDLERTHHIKTSMNELARLGLLSILRDYQQHVKESLVYKVKKS